MKLGYWLKPAGKVYSPLAFVSVVPDLYSPDPLTSLTSDRIGARGFAVSYHRRVGPRWERHEAATIEDATDLHDWIESLGQPSRCLYVVSPIASDTLTLSHFWNRLTLHGAKWERSKVTSERREDIAPGTDPYIVRALVCHGKPDIVRYSTHGKGFCWLSGYQYFNVREEELARSIGYKWRITGAQSDKHGEPTRDPLERSEMWAYLMTELCDWWRRVKGGPWGMTAGQLAMSFFRSRVQEKTVLVHNNEEAKRLESHAIYGGRASTWYFGDVGRDKYNPKIHPALPEPSKFYPVPGPIHHYDIRSMYPYLLGNRIYPVRWICNRVAPTVSYVRAALNDQCVIASCRLESNVGEYPCRRSDCIIYPTGQFDTVLCGPELVRAIDDGLVSYIYRSAHYRSGRPFDRMSADLISLRDESRASSNTGWDMFVKGISNSFSGKMAQKGGRWVEAPHFPAVRDWGEHYDLDCDTNTLKKYKFIASLSFEWKADELAGRPMGACYAYLTAYGRALMRAVRESLPPRSVVSQDTDGLWILAVQPKAQLERQLDMGPCAGQFRLVASSPFGRWFSPKHYCIKAGWILGGLHRPTPQSDGITFRDSYTRNLIQGSPNEAPDFILQVGRDVVLSIATESGRVGSAGWREPPHLVSAAVAAPQVPSACPSTTSDIPSGARALL